MANRVYIDPRKVQPTSTTAPLLAPQPARERSTMDRSPSGRVLQPPRVVTYLRPPVRGR